MCISKMQQKFEKRFLGSDINTDELVAGTSLSSEDKTCDRPSNCKKTVLRLHI